MFSLFFLFFCFFNSGSKAATLIDLSSNYKTIEYLRVLGLEMKKRWELCNFSSVIVKGGNVRLFPELWGSGVQSCRGFVEWGYRVLASYSHRIRLSGHPLWLMGHLFE